MRVEFMIITHDHISLTKTFTRLKVFLPLPLWSMVVISNRAHEYKIPAYDGAPNLCLGNIEVTRAQTMEARWRMRALMTKTRNFERTRKEGRGINVVTTKSTHHKFFYYLLC